jgi:hypothetical protein
MAIPIEAYTSDGRLSGMAVGVGRLRDLLEQGTELRIERCRRIGPLGRDEAVGDTVVAIDDLLLVPSAADDVPVHASWHAVELSVGPYQVTGELATMPGFDPGRALARPNGEFVPLRDALVGGATRHQTLLVNRYAVDAVHADLMLGFFFPGARIEVAPAETGAPPP